MSSERLDLVVLNGAPALLRHRVLRDGILLFQRAPELQRLVGDDEAYEAARRSALQLLEKGFHLGGKRVSREELHER